ncbi:heat shock protein HtpX [Rubripirellula tenax]|uniref:Heat shock protein HtpX n=1 Tax=Rubripirellula tenax TaxID=2528015 RepID=A0A5C6FKT4_9BACT|nr:M48 family metallopeptidase [Rubripirellula tenax]TWU60394.1 heat shock protein HtpX [Rubripirellula tenax]
MSETFQIACTECKQRLKVRQSARGKVVACPKCKTRVRIPLAKPDRPSYPSTPQANLPKQSRQQQSPPTAGALQPTNTPAPGKMASKDDEDLPVGKLLGSVSIPSPESFDFGAVPQTEAQHADQPDDFFGIAMPPAQATPFVAPKSRSATTPAIAPGSTPKAIQQDLSKVITQQLTGSIPNHRVSLGYRIGLSVNAVFMLMLPMAYLGLILLSIYGMYHYTFDVMPTMLQRLPRGRVAIIAMALYLTPIIAGITVIIFMIKPIFVAIIQPGDPRKRSINRENEPLLFELVDRICDVTGAPKPTRIDVDSEVNASASYGRGLRSLFSNDLVLTIGVPLVAGLNSREFAGVLAHEFGHFSQGAGMRASYLIRSINLWFARVVYQRDGLDEALDEAIAESENGFGLILLVAKLCVTLVRGVMWVFMMIAHATSCFLMRQMEFDADRYEAFVSGSDTFASTSRSMRLLGHAQHAAMIGLTDLIDKAVMIDDLPKMISVLERSMAQKSRQRILDGGENERTGLFDSHPCDAERVVAAAKWNAPGMWTVERPARDLFRHYDGLCRGVTQDFYRNQIGRLIDPNELQPVEQHLAGFSAW